MQIVELAQCCLGKLPMKLLSVILFTFVLSGCESVSNLSNSINEMTGKYTAPWLESTPTSRHCADARCRTLDTVEANGYELARQKRITWVSMVDTYYQKRIELFPRSNDSNGLIELRTYQRYLAEQMDSGKITETEWAYRVVSKEGEIETRNEMLEHSASAAAAAQNASKKTTCNTTNIGSAAFPNYQTTCN